MIRNSLFLTAAALALALFGLAGRLSFLAAMRRPLFLHCDASMAIFAGCFALNLFAAILAVNRKLLLKDTGRKLSHFDNQLQIGGERALPTFVEGPR